MTTLADAAGTSPAEVESKASPAVFSDREQRGETTKSTKIGPKSKVKKSLRYLGLEVKMRRKRYERTPCRSAKECSVCRFGLCNELYHFHKDDPAKMNIKMKKMTLK